MKDVTLPTEILAQLELGADLAISISGGKDSQALAIVLAELHRARGWTGACYAITADLGRIEWPESAAHCQRIADAAGVPLVTCRRFGRTQPERTDWDMIDRWKMNRTNRLAAGKTGLPWSGPDKGRFCTGELKTQPIDQEINFIGAQRTVCAVGIRHEESKDRATKPAWERRKNSNSKRVSLTWNPLILWTEQDVWETIGLVYPAPKPGRPDPKVAPELFRRRFDYANGRTDEALAGWNAHPAYVYGNSRLSCQFCVFGSIADLSVGARHRPDIAAELVAMEQESGFTFQTGRSLESIVRAVELDSISAAFLGDDDDMEVAA